jgi:hypothetical protein
MAEVKERIMTVHVLLMIVARSTCILLLVLTVGACGDAGGSDGSTGACTNASDSEAITSYMFGDLMGPDAINESGRLCASPGSECFEEAAAAAIDPNQENQAALSVSASRASIDPDDDLPAGAVLFHQTMGFDDFV